MGCVFFSHCCFDISNSLFSFYSPSLHHNPKSPIELKMLYYVCTLKMSFFKSLFAVTLNLFYFCISFLKKQKQKFANIYTPEHVDQCFNGFALHNAFCQAFEYCFSTSIKKKRGSRIADCSLDIDHAAVRFLLW